MALLFTLSSGVPPSTQKAEMLQSQETLSQDQEISESTSQTTPSTETQTFVKPKTITQKPFILVDTYIVSGPEQGESIEETNWVTFEFDAKASPKETDGQIWFETKIEGFDDGWISTFSRERTVVFPSGSKEYTFLVRAKIKDLIDPTPAERTFTINTSPYFGKIEISNAEIQTPSLPSLITLSARLEEEEKINITGWHIRARAGRFVFPLGIEKYLPFYNTVSTKNIFVKQNDTIYLSGDSSPLGTAKNFRPNKCFGYLANYRDFPIFLSRSCPNPRREEFSQLSLDCQQFILWIPECDIPDYSSNFEISRDSECVSYIDENFNYNGCFRSYSRDEDFLENEWHIYLNKDILTTNYCDTVYLRDQNGLLVDKYFYGPSICHW